MPVAASTLVAAARELADTFDRGGRLYVVGDDRAVADARHVAVEFLHPVIVGRCAPPSPPAPDRDLPATSVTSTRCTR